MKRVKHSRLVFAILGGGALLAFSNTAHAQKPPTKEQCISSNEDAQTLRTTRKLRAARTELLRCVAPSCPAAIRDDCSERLNEVERAIPTVVFGARAGSEELNEVTVTMDGAVLTERLDGSPVMVDPGEHSFTFAAKGRTTVSKKLIIAEGEKTRREVIDFAGAAAATPPAPTSGPDQGSPTAPATSSSPASSASSTEPPPAGEQSDGSGRRVLAYAVGGAGLVVIGVGAFFGLQAKSTYDEAESRCPRGPGSCDSEGVTGGEDAHSQATISTIAFIAGGALLAGGAVLFFTAPKKGGAALGPLAGPNVAGLRFGASW